MVLEIPTPTHFRLNPFLFERYNFHLEPQEESARKEFNKRVTSVKLNRFRMEENVEVETAWRNFWMEFLNVRSFDRKDREGMDGFKIHSFNKLWIGATVEGVD